MITLDCAIPDLEFELAQLLAQVPPGRVTTYGFLADALGLRNAARWIGEYLRDHEHAADCACHRVVRKDGELGLYRLDSDPAEKENLLRDEGVRLARGTVVDFESLAFREFRTRKPLARLIAFQQEIARRVCLEPYEGTPRLIAGLDVSYGEQGTAIGGCAIVETQSGSVVWSTTVRSRATLPYIPSLLTFRELPTLLSLYEEARKQSPELDLFLVDGNGILHPHGAGVATCFGVVADVPTIGVAKSLLCGQLAASHSQAEDAIPVMVEQQVVGTSLKWGRSAHPIYVSPGQGIDVASATRIVPLLNRGHRLPEPLYWADRLSRTEARRPMNP